MFGAAQRVAKLWQKPPAIHGGRAVGEFRAASARNPAQRIIKLTFLISNLDARIDATL
jgi:hypothetical protein